MAYLFGWNECDDVIFPVVEPVFSFPVRVVVGQVFLNIGEKFLCEYWMCEYWGEFFFEIGAGVVKDVLWIVFNVFYEGCCSVEVVADVGLKVFEGVVEVGVFKYFGGDFSLVVGCFHGLCVEEFLSCFEVLEVVEYADGAVFQYGEFFFDEFVVVFFIGDDGEGPWDVFAVCPSSCSCEGRTDGVLVVCPIDCLVVAIDIGAVIPVACDMVVGVEEGSCDGFVFCCDGDGACGVGEVGHDVFPFWVVCSRL